MSMANRDVEVEVEEEEEGPLKIYFIPYLASGHMIPLCDIATLFASRGHHVTIITTPFNAQSFTNNHHRKPDHHLHIHTVDFPYQEVGLSPDSGVEIMSNLTDLATSVKIHTAATLLREPIHRFLQHHPPDCIVGDFMMTWIDDVATTLDIPRFAFNAQCLFSVCAMETLKANPLPDSGSGSFVIPNFPHEITIRARPPKTFTKLTERLIGVEVKSEGLIVNNLVELDGEEYVEHYHKITRGHKAWHLGPASLIRKSDKEKAERGEKSVVSQHECLSWLNSKQPNSVLYICFGSSCRFHDKQLYEMACAIESTGHNFVWVVPEKEGKEDESEEDKEKWLPNGFEERNRMKGMIVRGWAPQVLILSHPAVGAFLSHSGWNSTVEAISAGVPMITWPVHGDQFFNEKLITTVRGIGVEVGVEEWSLGGYEERQKLVGRELIEKAVRRLMDGGDESEQIRRRAQEFGRKAAEALQEGGSSHRNLTDLIHHIKGLRAYNN